MENNRSKFSTIIIFLVSFSAFWSSSFLSVSVGSVQLTLYRLLLLCFVAITFLEGTKYIEVKTFEAKTMIFWWIYAIISFVWVKDISGWIKAVFFITCALLVLFCLSKCFDRVQNIEIFIRGLVVAGLVFIAFGIFEVETGLYLFQGIPMTDAAIITRRKHIPLFVTNGANAYALIVCFFFFVMLIMVLKTDKKWRKLFFGILTLSCLYLVYKTESRGVLAGLLFGVIMLIFCSIRKRIQRRQIFTLFTVFFLVIAFLIALLLGFEPLSFLGGEESDIIRLNLIKSGFDFLTETCFMGVGAGNIEYWMANKSHIDLMGYTNMHNWYMEILVGYGIIVFTLFIIMVVKMIRKLVFIYEQTSDKNISSYAFGFLGWNFAFLIACISDSNNMDNEWMWLMYAAVIAFNAIYYEKVLGQRDITV